MVNNSSYITYFSYILRKLLISFGRSASSAGFKNGCARIFRVPFSIYNIVIAKAFYLLLLIVTNKFGIYHHLYLKDVGHSWGYFILYFCKTKSTGSIPMLYNANNALVLLVISVLSLFRLFK